MTKRVRIAGIVILIITLVIAGANIFFVTLLDWSIRTTHIVMIIALLAVVFCTIRIKKEGNY